MTSANGLMAGKRGLIMGLANNRSIAWGIAKSLADQGAEIALTYQGDALKKRVEPLAAELGGIVVGHCDVSDQSTIDAVFETLKEKWGKIDFLVHAISYSNKDELTGRYVETSRDNFLMTMDISVYSFTAVAKAAEPLMRLDADSDLLWRRKSHAALQCHGRRQGSARGIRALSRC